MEQWSLPDVHTRLQEHLGDQYVASKWNESLDSVLRAENNVDAALAALQGHLWRMSTEGAKQTTLNAFFSLKLNWDIHLMKYTL